MTEASVPHGRQTQRAPAVAEIDILWLTAGLGCDGDTISITAATQPGIEDILRGAFPGLPKVNLHNPVLARENGDEFLPASAVPATFLRRTGRLRAEPPSAPSHYFSNGM